MRGLPAILVLLAALMTGACDATPNQFPVDFERMREQPRKKAYESSTFFEDGKIMRRPPQGTVPLERAPLVSGRRDARAVGVETTGIPVPMTLGDVERGRNRFDIFCAACHGVDGTARTAVADNMQLRRPPSLHDARIRALAAGTIFRVISEGYGLMPSYAHQLSVDDRWRVVGYVRALQLAAGVSLDELPPAVKAEASAALEGDRRD